MVDQTAKKELEQAGGTLSEDGKHFTRTNDRYKNAKVEAPADVPSEF